jgi:predicted tellurium resistance membrane protein TerC
MELVLGLLFMPFGIYLGFIGVKMFINSDGWFYLFKAVIVFLIGFMVIGSSYVGIVGG